MTCRKLCWNAIFFIVFIVALIPAHNVCAQFIDLGEGMIYDSDQNITWLQDSNYTLHHNIGGHNGQMTWSGANNWAKTFTLNGNSGWRLPHGPTANTSGPITVIATGGELYNLYYALGNTASSGWKNKGPFNMVWPGTFWTDLNANWTTPHHWMFDGSLGSNYFIGPDTNIEILWLVRDGRANHTLTVVCSGSGKGKVSSNPAGILTSATQSAGFPGASQVVLTATPNAPEIIVKKNKLPNGKVINMPLQAVYSFDGWSGDGASCPATQRTCVITMNKAKTVTATFNCSFTSLKIQPTETQNKKELLNKIQ